MLRWPCLCKAKGMGFLQLVLLFSLVFNFILHSTTITFAQGTNPELEKILPKKESIQHAYLAIAGPGTGQGMMGHAFAVFTTHKDRFLNSTAFQFNVKVDPAKMKTVSGFLGKDQQFFLSKEHGRFFIETYLLQDRPMFLYRLNLTPEELKAYYEKLESEVLRRSQNVITDYDVLKNNCLTSQLNVLNPILPKEKRISAFWLKEEKSYNALNPQTWVSNTPVFIVSVLDKHVLTPEKPVIIKPKIYDRLKINQHLTKAWDEFAQTCQVSYMDTEVSRQLIVNIAIRNTAPFLSRIRSIHDECKSANKGEAFTNVLDLIFFNVLEADVKKRILSYYP